MNQKYENGKLDPKVEMKVVVGVEANCLTRDLGL